MCVFVGACGVSGSAWQYMYSFYIHVHVIDTTHCIKKQKNKKKKEKMFILFFVIALFCSIVVYVSVTYLVHVIPIEELFFFTLLVCTHS